MQEALYKVEAVIPMLLNLAICNFGMSSGPAVCHSKWILYRVYFWVIRLHEMQGLLSKYSQCSPSRGISVHYYSVNVRRKIPISKETFAI